MAGKKKNESKTDKSKKEMERDESGTKGGEAQRNKRDKEEMVVDEFWVDEVTPDDELL